jgi:hypothetical protein
VFDTVEETAYTPAIALDETGRHIAIKGKSYPENVATFYGPFLTYLAEKLAEGLPIVLDIALVYFNSSSSKILMNIFDMFEEAGLRGTQCGVNWLYDAENELAKECGEEFRADYTAFAFNLKEQNKNEEDPTVH